MDVVPSSETDSQAGQFESVLSSINGKIVGATSPKAVQSALSLSMSAANANLDAKQPSRGYMWEDDAGYYYDDEESFTLRPVVDWSTR